MTSLPTTRRPLALIGYQCGWGAQVHECERGAKSLHDWGLAQKLRKEGIACDWMNLQNVIPTPENVEETVHAYCEALYHQVREALLADSFPVTLGGDHSMAVGTWSAVVDHYHLKRKMGLIWIDAHLDAHTMDTSPSKAIHGMPAASLVGVGEKSMVHLGSTGTKIDPAHLVYIGIRSFEAPEYNLLKSLGATIFTMDNVREKGMTMVMQEARDLLLKKVKLFGVTIDLDAFDPDRAPGVGSPEKNGLLRQEVYESLVLLKACNRMTALEIAEYNPSRDERDKTKEIVYDLISALCKP